MTRECLGAETAIVQFGIGTHHLYVKGVDWFNVRGMTILCGRHAVLCKELATIHAGM